MKQIRPFLYASVIALSAALLSAGPATASSTDPGCGGKADPVIGQFYAVRSIKYLSVGSEDTCYPRAVKTKIKYTVEFNVKDVNTGKYVMNLRSPSRTVTVGYGVSPTNLDKAESSSFTCVKGHKYLLGVVVKFNDGSGQRASKGTLSSSKVICPV
jgi:hypothetical protein